MRFGLMIAVIFFGVVFMANGSKIRNYNTPNIKQATRQRTIRGYTPGYWDTALGVGFGKRDGSNFNRREKVLMSLIRNFPQGESSEWLMREMKANPIFAGMLREMMINDGNDQTSIGEQFQPEGTVFVF